MHMTLKANERNIYRVRCDTLGCLSKLQVCVARSTTAQVFLRLSYFCYHVPWAGSHYPLRASYWEIFIPTANIEVI